MNAKGTTGRKQISKLILEKPTSKDGASMWELVCETGVLDVNSSYSYLMMCKFFSETCLVAKNNGDLAGFVTAFRPPEKPDTIFIWQIGVSSKYRGNGIGTKLLDKLLEDCENVNYLEATVTPSNQPSESLFRGIAKKNGANCEVFECFSEDHFPESGHEPELTYRIGPLN